MDCHLPVSFPCVCVCVCVCVFGMHAYMFVWGTYVCLGHEGLSLILGVFLYCSSPCSLRQSLSVEPRAYWYIESGQLAFSWDPLSLPSEHYHLNTKFQRHWEIFAFFIFLCIFQNTWSTSHFKRVAGICASHLLCSTRPVQRTTFYAQETERQCTMKSVRSIGKTCQTHLVFRRLPLFLSKGPGDEDWARRGCKCLL
jgi:hypothetical protein